VTWAENGREREENKIDSPPLRQYFKTDRRSQRGAKTQEKGWQVGVEGGGWGRDVHGK